MDDVRGDVYRLIKNYSFIFGKEYIQHCCIGKLIYLNDFQDVFIWSDWVYIHNVVTFMFMWWIMGCLEKRFCVCINGFQDDPHLEVH